MQIQIFSFFLGKGTMLTAQSGCCSSLTKSKSINFLTSDSIASIISIWNYCCCCLTDLASGLKLRRCIAIWGLSPGMFSYFHMRCTKASFSESDKLLLMENELGVSLISKIYLSHFILSGWFSLFKVYILESI